MNRGGSQGVQIIEGLLYIPLVLCNCRVILYHPSFVVQRDKIMVISSLKTIWRDSIIAGYGNKDSRILCVCVCVDVRN